LDLPIQEEEKKGPVPPGNRPCLLGGEKVAKGGFRMPKKEKRESIRVTPYISSREAGKKREGRVSGIATYFQPPRSKKEGAKQKGGKKKKKKK